MAGEVPVVGGARPKQVPVVGCVGCGQLPDLGFIAFWSFICAKPVQHSFFSGIYFFYIFARPRYEHRF